MSGEKSGVWSTEAYDVLFPMLSILIVTVKLQLPAIYSANEHMKGNEFK